jgi:hypothetical protein
MRKIKIIIGFVREADSPFLTSMRIVWALLAFPIGVVHEFFHIFFLTILGVKWKLEKERTYFMKRTGNTMTDFSFPISFNTTLLKSLIICAAPVLGYVFWVGLTLWLPFLIEPLVAKIIVFDLMLVYVMMNWNMIGMSPEDKESFHSTIDKMKEINENDKG